MPSSSTGQISDNDENLNILHEGLACGVIVCDGAGKITVFPPEAEKLTRLAVRQALGRPVSVLPAALQKLVGEVLAGDKSTASRQISLVDGERGVATVRAHVTAIPAAKGKPLGAVILLTDLALARRLEQNIRRLDRLANIGTLSASLAHEIKNALVAVRTFVDLLLEKNQDAELAEVVGREMKRIDALVSQMLRVANPAKASLAPVALHELLDHSLRLVQHQLNEKLIVLRRSFATAPDVVNGNSYQLEQAFMNLLLNALEAMGPNGELTVRTEIISAGGQRPARISLTFQDTGIGIPPENMGRLFETFFTTKKNGTGLGLAITRRIVHEHHGEIAVESKPNQGAAFRVTLPLA